MNVVIADNNSENLKGAKDMISKSGSVKVEAIEMDVGKVEDFEGLKVGVFLFQFRVTFGELAAGLIRHLGRRVSDGKTRLKFSSCLVRTLLIHFT